ncbi:hypothetical protein Ahy_A07g036439 isoform B [Arachis hypogaea]|uniref:Uncharacterized protein n=1 Tax=Arachis hypogaea TaxID=3818 RepID=A0A445CG64_ARAHY|nr:hypothetical protein Ahy_A07g036439 isoform B [Arachis hypogaea]
MTLSIVVELGESLTLTSVVSATRFKFYFAFHWASSINLLYNFSSASLKNLNFGGGDDEGLINLLLNSEEDGGEDDSKRGLLNPSRFSKEFLMAFAIFWAATQQQSYSWIGQDILLLLVTIKTLFLVLNHFSLKFKLLG